MLVKRMVKELKKFNQDAIVRGHGLEGYGIASVIAVSSKIVVLKDTEEVEGVEPFTAAGLVKILETLNPEAEVKMHEEDGCNALFVLAYVKFNDTIVIEDKSDNDLGSELDARYENAKENNIDKKELYSEMKELGYTLEDIKENYPEIYDEAASYYNSL